MIDIYFILRGLVYAQSFLWLYLIDKDYEVNNYFIRVLFPTSLGIIYLMLDMSGFSFSQYPNHLLRFYVLLMLYTYTILSIKHSFYDTVCLTFLLVFINSYYWEFMRHFNVILFYGLSFNQLIQAFHLIPVYLLYVNLEIKDRSKFFKLIVLGLVISNLSLLVYNFVDPFWFYMIPINSNLFNNITRFLCLNILIYAINKYTNITKKEGDIKFPFLDSR